MAPAQRSAGDPAPMALARPAAQATLSQGAIPGPSIQSTAIAAPASPPPVFGPTASVVVQRVDGSAPAAPPPTSAERSDGELDELARQLFGRFRSRLRNEYIYEREAKGLTFDNS